MVIAYIVTVALLVAALIVEKILNQKTVADLNDRLAAKSLEEYKYEKEIRPVELKHNEEMLKLEREKAEIEVKREKNMTADERASRDEAKRY